MAFEVKHYKMTSKNNEAEQQFVKAMNFLKDYSPLAKEIIEDLEDSGSNIKVVVNDDKNQNLKTNKDFNGWRPPMIKFKKSGSLIQWWSAREKVNGKRSAELGLMHEMGHALQFLSEHKQWKRAFQPKYKKLIMYNGTDMEESQIEDTVSISLERTVANEINEMLLEEKLARKISNADYELRLEPIRKAYRAEGQKEDFLPGDLEQPKPKLKRLGARHFPKKPKI
jgi:hypothetical protein